MTYCAKYVIRIRCDATIQFWGADERFWNPKYFEKDGSRDRSSLFMKIQCERGMRWLG
jgi:hypothetical protein